MLSRYHVICIALFLLIGLFSESMATVTIDNGVFGATITNAGTIRLYTPNTSGTRQLYRINIIAALSEDAVCDLNEDQDYLITSYPILAPTVADVEGFAEYNNQNADLPLAVRFKLHVYVWNNESYLLAEYTTINDSQEPYLLYLGIVVLPQISGSYGGETNDYDAENQVAYSYRTGENTYAGIQLLSAPAYSFKNLDWDIYSPEDPNNDAASDSTRYHMTADLGFDGMLTASGDGSIYSLNAGSVTLAPGDSTTIMYAVVYDTSATALIGAAEFAKGRYDELFTSVREQSRIEAPASFNLEQNYPNPFNPSTFIRFSLAQSANAELGIYNLQGEQVRLIASGILGAGSHELSWDGKDDLGQPVGSGVYLYQFKAGNSVLTKKMMLIK